MGIVHDTIGIYVVLKRPLAPYALHGQSGINKNSVKIEENGLAGEDHGSGYQPEGRRAQWV